MIVDTNIIIDLIDMSDETARRSGLVFARYATIQRAAINHVIFAEASCRHSHQFEIEEYLEEFGIKIISFSNEDAFRAGVAFQQYRRRGGPREAILPDFLIGAQAAVRGWPLLTRDKKRFEAYFPEVELIDPNTVTL
jgi:predicted nucleic acid-binding protein